MNVAATIAATLHTIKWSTTVATWVLGIISRFSTKFDHLTKKLAHKRRNAHIPIKKSLKSLINGFEPMQHPNVIAIA